MGPIQGGLGWGKGRRVIKAWMQHASVDFDDQPPNLQDQEDSRPIDRESIEHDREERDIRRLEEEVRGHTKPEKRCMAKATLRSEPRGR
jgi:hypothetical protein